MKSLFFCYGVFLLTSLLLSFFFFFFFNDTATTEIYTLSLHDALPILSLGSGKDAIDLYYFGAGHTNGDAFVVFPALRVLHTGDMNTTNASPLVRSEEHTSELQSLTNLVCRLLLEKKKKNKKNRLKMNK